MRATEKFSLLNFSQSYVFNKVFHYAKLSEISSEVVMLKGRHVIEPTNLSVSEIDEICTLAEQMIVDPKSFVAGKFLRHFFLSQVREQGFLLKRQCSI